jgi:undecaprenyl-diphosphatase
VWKQRDAFVPADAPIFMIGLAFAFVSAAVHPLADPLHHHDFVPFGWYRIAFGGVSC